MNRSRIKFADKGAYYHLFNRVGGPVIKTPFNAADREYGIRLLHNLSEYFLLEIIAFAWMGNHFHLIAYAPPVSDLPSDAEIAERHNRYVRMMKKRYPHYPAREITPANPAQCRKIGRRMLDISWFMKAYQQQFSTTYNRVHDTTGTLWAGRFKSVLLEGNTALLECLYYVELNPVRSGITATADAYRYNSWGRLKNGKYHPCHEHFVKHIREALGPDGAAMQDTELFEYVQDKLNRIIDSETRPQATTRRESMHLRYLSRTRHFTEGAILGSKEFILQGALQILSPERARHKQFSRGTPPTATSPLYCFKKLT